MPEEFRDAIDPNAGDGFDLSRVGGTDATAPEPSGKPRRLKKDGTPWGYRTGPRTGAGAGAPAKEKISRSLDLSSITGLFVGFHVLLSERTGIPELTMDMSEGKQLQVAVENVMRHYPVDTTQKTVDWASLVGVLAMLYGTRWGAYMMRKHAEKRPGTVNFTAMHSSAQPGAPLNGSGRASAAAPAPVFAEDALIVTDHESD